MLYEVRIGWMETTQGTSWSVITYSALRKSLLCCRKTEERETPLSSMHNSAFEEKEEEVGTAQMDAAHVGDIHGAWGTIRSVDTPPHKT